MVVPGDSNASVLPQIAPGRLRTMANSLHNYERPPLGSTVFGSFLVIVFILDWVFPEWKLFHSWILNDRAVGKFEIYRLVTYTWVHLGVLHILFNLVILMSLLSKFERQFGTARTALILVCLSVAPGLVYCALEWLFFPNTSVGGASGLVFSLWGYFSYRDSLTTPTMQFSDNFSIPMWATPLLTLFITAAIMPGSSFIGHLLGLVAGWGFALGYFEDILESSSGVILKFETYAERLVNACPPSCMYVKEVQVKDNRPILRSPGSESGQTTGGNRGIGGILPFFRDTSIRLPQFGSGQPQSANVSHIPGGFRYNTIDQDANPPRNVNETAFQGSGHSLS